MKTWAYIITPFLAWLMAGTLKFFINCLREKRLAIDLIGYGGMPSNHSAIVSSMVFLIGLREGFDSAPFGVALTLAFIVTMDANKLRQAIGRHAVVINHLTTGDSNLRLRERMGHNKVEIIAGILVGFIVGYVINSFAM